MASTRCRESILSHDFQKTVREWSLFQGGEKILLGVSGGIDSVTLLHLFNHLPPPWKPKIRVVHFNHRLRGRASDRDESFVKKICCLWDVSFSVGRAPTWKKRNNLEARAREIRYRFFKRTARRFQIRKIVTAHQADDQAETFVMRWLQGAGLKGLSGIPLRREEGGFQIVRPLLFVPRRQILAYAKAHRIAYREDSSNRSDRHFRNRIRKWMTTLKRENPRLAERTTLNSIFLRGDYEFLEGLTEDLFREGFRGKKKGRRFSLSTYRKAPDSLRYRLIQRIVREVVQNGVVLPAEAVFEADRLLRDPKPHRVSPFPGGLRLVKDYLSFWFENAALI